MSIKSWFRKEKRADGRASGASPPKDKQGREDFSGETLLHALMGNGGRVITKAEALNIPSVQGCISFIANAVSSLPLKLYTEHDGKADEIKDDNRIRLLNDDTGDTLDSVQFWRAIITDYWLGKGGYAYIRRERNQIISLHYVDEINMSVNTNCDPIFKDYDIYVNGMVYKPYEFLKILRNTKNGASGQSIIQDSPLALSVLYNSLKFEDKLVKKGGNKRGFLISEERLAPDEFDRLKKAWTRANNDGTEVFALNKGLTFQETSSSSTEMQLNENKEINSAEICKLFNIAASVINGTASAAEYSNAFKHGVTPVLKTIECALNRDMLLEKEKQSYYFAFDTKEMLKGDIKSRFEAYKVAIETNFMGVDEVRFMEDLPAWGIDFIKFGLDSVLYNPKTKKFYTPNTNKLSNMLDMKEGEINADRDTE